MTTANAILLLKSLHIVGFVFWLAGLFYLVRLFIYHVEARNNAEPDRSVLINQYSSMESRAYKVIVNPGMMITWTAGILMLILNSAYLSQGWMHIKLTLLILLLIYHIWSKQIMKKLQSGGPVMSRFRMRLFNKVPVVLLAAIAFLTVLGRVNALNYAYLGIGLVLFSLFLYMGVRVAESRRGESAIGRQD